METFEYPSLFLSPLTFLLLVLSVFHSLVDFTLLPPFHFAAFYLPKLQTYPNSSSPAFVRALHIYTIYIQQQSLQWQPV